MELVKAGYEVKCFEGLDPQWRYVVQAYLDGTRVIDTKWGTRPWANAFYFEVIDRIKRGEGHALPVSCSN